MGTGTDSGTILLTDAEAPVDAGSARADAGSAHADAGSTPDSGFNGNDAASGSSPTRRLPGRLDADLR